MAAVATISDPEVQAINDHAAGATEKYVRRVGTLAFDSSYPTGGEAIDLGELGLDSVLFARFGPATAGYSFNYNYTNNKVLAFYGDFNAVADGALIQVPNATNLAALTAVPFYIIGVASEDGF